jgi:hypothetical protein
MRRARWLMVAVVVVAAALAVANIPTTTDQGVDFKVTRHSLPLYVKVLDFAERDVNYKRLAGDITGGAASDEARLRAVFDWTRTNIRNTPPGFPVIDDHVWHIVVRGYGQDDQKADVFTTLLSYAGVSAYWIFVGPRPELALSLAKIDGRWRLVDVPNGVIFRTPDGRLATVDEVSADHRLAITQGPEYYGGIGYGRYFNRFRSPDAPVITRPEMQMFWPRLWFNLRHLAGRSGRAWEMRPASREAAGIGSSE